MDLREHVFVEAAQAKRPVCGAGEFLTLRLGAEEYGIDILRVREIRGYEPPTRIANATAYIKGVINLRGIVVPIVDLRMRFNLSDAQYNDLTVVVVLDVKERTVGVVVDSVSDVVALTTPQIKPVPEFNTLLNASFITGLGCVNSDEGDRMLVLLDVEMLLSNTLL